MVVQEQSLLKKSDRESRDFYACSACLVSEKEKEKHPRSPAKPKFEMSSEEAFVSNTFPSAGPSASPMHRVLIAECSS
jgi:hypothetical protein